jgi:glycine betaine/proline transport system ATP-binding protein
MGQEPQRADRAVDRLASAITTEPDVRASFRPFTDRDEAPASAADTMIRATGLSKVFGSAADHALSLLAGGATKHEIHAATGCTVAVDDVSFEIERGELFVIMGLSGSGKSTLIRLVNRLIEPTAGSVEVDGRDVSSLSAAELRRVRNRKLSMVFQHFALFPHRTVRENAAYGLHVRGAAERERYERAEWALDLVGLSDWVDARPTELSGGMKQRVGLARALATDADVLLMDEPFSALDPLIRRDMQDLMLRLQRELRRTVVFVTHDLNEAMRIGDRIMLMRDGRAVQIGTTNEILARPADDYVRRFIAEVDRSRVLTAHDIMGEPRAVAASHEDPRDVLERLRSSGARGVYVLDHGQLVGVIDEAGLVAAVATGEHAVKGTAISQEYETAPPGATLVEICSRVGGRCVPLGVIGDDRALLGVVPRPALIGAIAGVSRDA